MSNPTSHALKRIVKRKMESETIRSGTKKGQSVTKTSKPKPKVPKNLTTSKSKSKKASVPPGPSS
jgi:hypothetical protein